MDTNHTLKPQSIDPNVVRNVERQIIREAKNEETAIKHALKDLGKKEKEEGKAYKHSLKARGAVEKSEKQEQSSLKKMYKAQQKHEIVAANLQRAHHDYQIHTQHHERLVDEVNTKKQDVETCMKINDERTLERNKKLNALHATDADGTDEAHLGLPLTSNPAQPSTGGVA